MRVFTAKWCEACKGLKETLAELGIEYEEVDVDIEPEKTQKAGVKAVPTMLLGKHFKVGNAPAESVVRFIETYGVFDA